MRAVVVGGGVAGPAVAVALRQVGWDVVVLESRPAGPGSGSWFTVSPNGLDALDVLGLLPVVRPLGVASRTNVMAGADGRELGRLPLGAPLADGTPALTMRRSALAEVLREQAVAAGAQVREGARVVGARDDGASASVELASGERVSGDVVVGADGVRSVVRAAVDPDVVPRYVGLANFGGITRATSVAAELEPEAWRFVFGRRAFVGMHPTPDGDVVWFVNVPSPPITRQERAETSDEQWRAWLLERVSADPGPAAALVAAGELELVGDSTYDLPRVGTWSRGRVVLVGDAVHAPSPSSGQGASLALEDAVVLARALAASSDPAAAFADYEGRRRTRVEKVVAAGARSSSAKIPGRVARPLVELGMRAAFRLFVTERSTAWMTGHRLERSASVG